MPGTVFVQAGQDWVVDKIQAAGTQHIGWGTGVTDPVEANVGLQTPANEARAQAVLSQPTADVSRAVATLTANATKTISEVGLFDAATAGTLIIRATFTGIPLISGDRIEFTIDLQVT